MSEIGVGVIGGGLMGRELAATIGRWPTIKEDGDIPVLRGACDTNPAALEWFRSIASVTNLATDYRSLLEDPSIDVLYIALPHNLHQRVYIDVIEAGKDFLGEKPFGFDLDASRAIVDALHAHPDVFARVSSEMPFFPGAQEVFQRVRAGDLGEILEVQVGLEHSSDLDRNKLINWKRQAEFCGPGGVMADLGLHPLHLPLRLGWMPERLFAVLTNVVQERRNAAGDLVPCDTWDNASILARVGAASPFPMSVDMKRIAPGQNNTWRIRALGMDGGISYTSRSPAVVQHFAIREGRQGWSEELTGTQSVVPTSIPPLVEFGFSDAILQMWATFFAEREGRLGDRFGCATPEEALQTHEIFTASIESQANGSAVAIAARSAA